MVGVCIYFNNRSKIEYICVLFDNLIEYINDRYKRIALISDVLKSEIYKVQKEWIRYKIILVEDDIENLKNIKNELLRRYEDVYYIDELISYITCDCTEDRNRKVIDSYRKEIREIIPQMVYLTNILDHENLFLITEKVKNQKVDNIYQNYDYQVEKIFNNLYESQDESKITWALYQVKCFANEFAKKWVTILPDKMSFAEIKLLVTIACRCEARYQKDSY